MTNDFRDGFRPMKYNLNNKGNALDASLFHRLELYCKELELEFTLENTKAKDSENSKEIKSTDKVEVEPKNKSSIELFLDLMTLKLYRNTSDHHTNLLRIINFMILTIAVYGLYIFMYEKLILILFIDIPYNLICSILLFMLGLALLNIWLLITKYNIAWKNMLVGFIMIISTSVAIISMIYDKYVAYIALFITLYLFLYYKAITKLKYDLAYVFYYGCVIAIFFIKPFLIAPFIGMFKSEQTAESRFEKYIIEHNENDLDGMLLDAKFTDMKNENKLNFIVKNRKIILEKLDNDETLLIVFIEDIKSLIDHNTSNKNIQKIPKKPYAEALKYDEIIQTTQKSANLLYSFIMLLVIYSLTKTARRNSVVPS